MWKQGKELFEGQDPFINLGYGTVKVVMPTCGDDKLAVKSACVTIQKKNVKEFRTQLDKNDCLNTELECSWQDRGNKQKMQHKVIS